ncbi:hypothetical protein ACVNIS_05660 [Sphaerotilaceae bacterium SBD11-9]
MTLVLRLSALMTAAFLGACASPAPDKVASTSAEPREVCEPTVGSRICRKPGTGNTNAVQAVSGDDLRRSGGPITGPQLGTIGN